MFSYNITTEVNYKNKIELYFMITEEAELKTTCQINKFYYIPDENVAVTLYYITFVKDIEPQDLIF